jgi:dUTP pyrophosphatase
LTAKQILEEGIITNMIDEKIQKQQVGIDCSVKEVHIFCQDDCIGTSVLDFDNSQRKIIKPLKLEMENIELRPGQTYLLILNEQFKIPMNVAGMIIPRSSLHSMGITVDSAIFDPGYSGGARLFCHCSVPVILKPNARIGQFICWRLEQNSDNEYNGIWKKQHENWRSNFNAALGKQGVN